MSSAASSPESVSDSVLDALLVAGNWSITADDNGGNERVPESSIKAWVEAAGGRSPDRQSIVDLGVLVLAISVAEWGVKWDGSSPSDPVNSNWSGPKAITSGKHLMSYALGGVGLPHLDTGDAVDFFKHLASLNPGNAELADYVRRLPADFHYDQVRAAGGLCDGHDAVAKTDVFGEPFHHDAVNFGGADYCQRFNPRHVNDPEQWQKFRSWARFGLRQRQMQRWIVDTWINRYWLPAYSAVMAHSHGSLSEAFVVARIWNSGSGLARQAMMHAGDTSDPTKRVELELDKYGEGSRTRAGRRQVMQRPSVIYQKFALRE